MIELKLEERLGLFQEIREKTESKEKEQAQTPKGLFWKHSSCLLCYSR